MLRATRRRTDTLIPRCPKKGIRPPYSHRADAIVGEWPTLVYCWLALFFQKSWTSFYGFRRALNAYGSNAQVKQSFKPVSSDCDFDNSELSILQGSSFSLDHWLIQQLYTTGLHKFLSRVNLPLPTTPQPAASQQTTNTTAPNLTKPLSDNQQPTNNN